MDEWKVLRDLLIMDPEIDLAIKAVTSVIDDRVRPAIKSKCEGCDNQWSSQRDHECLMNYNKLKKQCIDEQLELLTELDNLAIILRMAKIAKQEGFTLKHPDWAIRMMKSNHMKKVKQALYQKLDDEYDCDDVIVI